MSTNGNANGPGDPRTGAQITITLQSDGRVNITGPLPDKILCFGMLEMAKLLVAQFQQPKVQVPNIVVPRDLPGRG